MIALVGPGITPDQWILNPVLVKSIIAVLKFVRSRVTSTHELQEVYQYVAQLWDQLGYLGDYTKKQIHDLCDLLFWFWIPDPESDDKPVIPTACQFFRKDIIALMICNSDHEALIDLFVDNFQALSANNNVRIYRNSVNAVSLMMLRKLIHTGHLHDSILLIVLKDWLQKHRSTEDSKEQDRFIEIIREIVAEDYSAGVLMRILNDRTTLISDHPSEFQKRFGAHLWVGFHWLYLVAYSWVFERRIKTNDNLSKMYLPPEFIHRIDCSDDTLVKILDFIEYPINIKVAERDGPRAFCERMRVKIGQLDLNRASLATRLHFHPKVSQVEYP
jgi:hypothetical protein